MNLSSTIELYGGGPGSGCNPEVGHCGRPETESKHGLTELLRKTVEQFGGKFGNWSGLYRKGHAGVVAPFTKEEKAELKQLLGKYNCKVGQCYMNAQTMALRGENNPKLKYMEGLVTVHGVPIDHAWLEYNGKVFDPTLYTPGTFKMKKIAGKTQSPGEYYGMEVPKDLITKNQLEMKTYSPLTAWPSKFAKKLLEE